MKREYVLLAHDYEPKRINSIYWLLSEKLDGFRGFWDGGISRGMLASDIPWANTANDDRLTESVYATGLWSRYGKVIRAPDSFLDQMPSMPLDGELWGGRGQFQRVRSICSQFTPNEEDWKTIKFLTIDQPTMTAFLSDGEIKNPNCKMTFSGFRDHALVRDIIAQEQMRTFDDTYKFLSAQDFWTDQILLHAQTTFPTGGLSVEVAANLILEMVETAKGEGVILRKAMSYWKPYRSYDLLKLKACKDHEGIVIGYVSGVEGKEGRRLGKLGSLIVQSVFRDENGNDMPPVLFNLSGFNDSEIALEEGISDWATSHPNTTFPPEFDSPVFRRGDVISFKYRELTDDGKPKEARYWRK